MAVAFTGINGVIVIVEIDASVKYSQALTMLK